VELDRGGILDGRLPAAADGSALGGTVSHFWRGVAGTFLRGKPRIFLAGIRLLIFHMGTWGFSPGGGQTEKIVHKRVTKDTPGRPLPLSLQWLECSHNEVFVL